MDEARLTELSRRLGVAVAEMESAYRFAEEYEDMKDEVMKPLLEAKAQIDGFMDTLPKKQQAIYAQSIEDTKAAKTSRN